MKTTITFGLALISTTPGACDSLGPGCVPRFATGDDHEEETSDVGTSTGADTTGTPPPLVLTDNGSGAGENTSLGDPGWATSTTAESSATSTTGESSATSTPPSTWTSFEQATSDPGETTNGPIELCGNGVVDSGEACDDANNINFDECSNVCHDNTNSGCNEMFLLDPACEGLYCVGPGLCGGCQAIPAPKTCFDVDVEAPACDEESGICVECTPGNESACTNDSYAHCNPYTLECDQCLNHDQCDDSACLFEMAGTSEQIAQGECAPITSIAWVHRQMVCQGKNGSEEQPYCTIAEAIADPRPEWAETLVIMLVPSLPAYEATILVGNRKIAVVGTSAVPAEYPSVTTPGAEPLASVQGGYVLFSRVQLRDSTNLAGPLISIKNGEGELEHTIVTGNNGAIQTVNSDLELYHVLHTGNTGAGSEFAYSNVNISNTFITANDAGGSAPVILSGESIVYITYSTIAGNQGDYASTIGCNGNGLLQVTNSIVLYNGDDGFKCEKQSPSGLVGDFATLKDGTFVKYTGGIYQIDVNSLAKGQASSDESDPYTDYDGDIRPRSYGALEYAGADRPPK